MRGRGIKNNLRDVIYGWPLTVEIMFHTFGKPKTSEKSSKTLDHLSVKLLKIHNVNIAKPFELILFRPKLSVPIFVFRVQTRFDRLIHD